jgi:hypothetical protein
MPFWELPTPAQADRTERDHFRDSQCIMRLKSAGREETAVGADQDFDAFLHEWTEERIWPVEHFLDERDQKYLAERRSIELIQLFFEPVSWPLLSFLRCGRGECVLLQHDGKRQ